MSLKNTDLKLTHIIQHISSRRCTNRCDWCDRFLVLCGRFVFLLLSLHKDLVWFVHIYQQLMFASPNTMIMRQVLKLRSIFFLRRSVCIRVVTEKKKPPLTFDRHEIIGDSAVCLTGRRQQSLYLLLAGAQKKALLPPLGVPAEWRSLQRGLGLPRGSDARLLHFKYL